MKRSKITIPKFIFTIAFVVCALVSQQAQAQITFDDDIDDETPAAPIDGLLGLGLAAGAMYGIKKLKGNK